MTDAPPDPDIARLKRARQLIGIARRQLGIDDATHGDIVARITAGRTRSTLDCTAAELRQIQGDYQRAGWQPRPAGAAAPSAAPAGGDGRWQTPARMLWRIDQMLQDMDLSRGYAAGILRQQRGLPRGVAAPLELASASELRGVIAALDRHRRRQPATPETAP